jgi:hypothetical protein
VQLDNSLREIADVGERMLQNPDVRQANAWLRQRIKVIVQDCEVLDVQYLAPDSIS